MVVPASCNLRACVIQYPHESRDVYDQNLICLPWQDLTQERHTKLCNPIPRFARWFPYLYYSHTTFQNNHILPKHDENNSPRPSGRRLLLTVRHIGIGFTLCLTLFSAKTFFRIAGNAYILFCPYVVRNWPLCMWVHICVRILYMHNTLLLAQSAMHRSNLQKTKWIQAP